MLLGWETSNRHELPSGAGQFWVRRLKRATAVHICAAGWPAPSCPPGGLWGPRDESTVATSTTIDHVLQTWHPFLPKFSIQDADRHRILRVVGPCWTCGCGTDTNFEVKTLDESLSVGHTSKQWAGWARGRLPRALPDADDIGLRFPLDLDMRVKAVLLRATFLIDYKFFEKRGGTGSSAITS
ncbi:unnamed protein product [Pipistrellus nathusii]|uniref:Phospholipid scramblase n=1 Tax=Pipistrellus nathusii TaxID=59473 RepID=A0ABN9ZXG3_PIPNA